MAKVSPGIEQYFLASRLGNWVDSEEEGCLILYVIFFLASRLGNWVDSEEEGCLILYFLFYLASRLGNWVDSEVETLFDFVLYTFFSFPPGQLG